MENRTKIVKHVRLLNAMQEKRSQIEAALVVKGRAPLKRGLRNSLEGNATGTEKGLGLHLRICKALCKVWVLGEPSVNAIVG